MSREPNTTILTRIHSAHPQADVQRTEGGLWRAVIRRDSGETAIYRQELADLESRLDRLAEEADAAGAAG